MTEGRDESWTCTGRKPTARSRKHLCGKQTCAGCLTCADPGPKGACGPCSRNVTSTPPARETT